jgi:hypothetical protein
MYFQLIIFKQNAKKNNYKFNKLSKTLFIT